MYMVQVQQPYHTPSKGWFAIHVTDDQDDATEVYTDTKEGMFQRCNHLVGIRIVDHDGNELRRN